MICCFLSRPQSALRLASSHASIAMMPRLLLALTILASMGLMGCLQGIPVGGTHPFLGRAMSSNAQCGPNKTMLILWSPHCMTCKPWLAEVDRLWRQSDRTTSVRGIVCDGDETASQAVLSKYRIDFPQLVDTRDACTNRYGVKELPRLLVLDECGRLVYASPEDLKATDLERVLLRFLS